MTSSSSPLASGDRYELVADWAKLPPGWELGQTNIVTDSEDRVYLFNRGTHPLIVLDRDGTVLDHWGQDALTSAHGGTIDADGNLYLPVFRSHVVLKYTPDGRLLQTLGRRDEPSDTGWPGDFHQMATRAAGPFNWPTDVDIAPNGDVLISDGYGNARIHRFSPDGELLQSWGDPGSGAGEFHVPHGVWARTPGRIMVADRENNRVQVFTETGEYIEEWSGFKRPCDIFVDADETVYVTELDRFLTLCDLDGRVRERWLSPTSRCAMDGGHAVWVDSLGDVYVNQSQPVARLLKYRRR